MHRRHFVVLAFALAACGPSTPLPATSAASTEAVRQEIETGVAATLTAGAPTATPVPSDTPVPTATTTLPPTDTPTRTPRPSATTAASDTPAPTSTNTRVPATLAPPTATVAPTPDFVGIALAVRAQVDNFGWQIDLAVRRGGLDCVPIIESYQYVAARTTLTVPGSLAGPYQLYTNGVGVFLSNAESLYSGCVKFMAGEQVSSISGQAWTNARTKVTEARDILSQAIAAAGGTP